MRSNRGLIRAKLSASLLLALTASARAGDGPGDPLPPSSSPQIPRARVDVPSKDRQWPALETPDATLPKPETGTGPGATPPVPPTDGSPSNPSTPPSSSGSAGASTPNQPAAEADGGAQAAQSGAGAGTGTGTGTGGPGGAFSSGLGGVPNSPSSYFNMQGDQAPPISYRSLSAAATTTTGNQKNPPTVPPPHARSQIAPSVRGFKIAENQSPVPQDRVFFSFNSFTNLNSQLNKYFEAPIKGVNIYRYTFGFEKTFNNGMGSVGMLLPLDNVFARSSVATLNEGGNATSLGNLTIFAKHIFYVSPETGSVTSGGFAITPQTAPGSFGGARFLSPSNTTTFQPFFAYLIKRDRFYFQGFTALDIPVDPSQPTLIYNDFGVGYFVYRNDRFDTLITGVAPTVELHLNNPINHSGPYNRLDSNGTADIVDITTGLNTRIRENSVLSMGVVVPVTGPRPFSVEGTLLLNYYFGRSRRNAAPPIIGG